MHGAATRTTVVLLALAAWAGGCGHERRGDRDLAAGDSGVDATVPADGEGDDRAGPDDAADLRYLEDACPYACPHPDPGVGSVIVSEILHTPCGAADPDGDWFELYNTTDWQVDVAGWTVADGTGADVVLGDPGVALVVPAGGQIALARTADPARNGGFVPAWAFGEALSLGPEGRLELSRGEVVVDVVTWGGEGFPGARCASLNLSGEQLRADTNDAAEAWCESFYGHLPDGDTGTPGTDNYSCCHRC